MRLWRSAGEVAILDAVGSFASEGLMVTPLAKAVKRSVDIDGTQYTVVIDPQGLRLVGKGRRKATVELHWKDLVSGEAALAVALNASVGRT